MKNNTTQFESRDLFLMIFVLVAGWLLLFQSNLF